MTDIISLQPVTIEEIPLQAIKVLSSHLYTFLTQACDVKLPLGSSASHASPEESGIDRQAPLVARQLMQRKLLYVLNEEQVIGGPAVEEEHRHPDCLRITILVERLSSPDSTFGQLKETCEAIIAACDEACLRNSTAHINSPTAAADLAAHRNSTLETRPHLIDLQDPLGLTMDQVWAQLSAQLFFQ